MGLTLVVKFFGVIGALTANALFVWFFVVLNTPGVVSIRLVEPNGWIRALELPLVAVSFVGVLLLARDFVKAA